MALNKVTTYEDAQVDFSGGIVEQRSPSAFTDRAVAIARGFMFESETELRSQPACQRVGWEHFIALTTFSSAKADYLVAITNTGQIKWAYAPDDYANNQATSALTWNAFAGLPQNTKYRFLLDNDNMVDATGRYAALTLSYNDTAPVVGIRIYEGDDAPGLKATTYSDNYPVDTAKPVVEGDTTTVTDPKTNVFPPANVGTKFLARVFYGDTILSKDSTALSATSAKKYHSAFWYSELSPTMVYANSNEYLGSTEAQIRGMHALDTKVVAITTSGPEGDGLVTLTGPFTASANVAAGLPRGQDLSIKILRGGTGAPRQTTDEYRPYSCVWPETGTVCFIDRLGGVWSTEGQTVERIDTFGPKSPTSADENDHCVALGKHLFVSRQGRLLVLTLLGQVGDDQAVAASAAWTELITPDGQPKSMATLGNNVYFLTQDGRPYRYALTGPTFSERGYINGTSRDLVLGTRTHGDPGRHDRKTWLRFSFRFRGIRAGEVRSVTIRPRPVLDGGNGYAVTPSDPVIGDRYSAHLRAGIGGSLEASAEIVVRGDVVFEEYVWTVSGVEPAR